MKKEWFDQLPLVAALCYSAQDEPDTTEAVREALELLTTCEEVDPMLKAEQNLSVFSADNITEVRKDKKK